MSRFLKIFFIACTLQFATRILQTASAQIYPVQVTTQLNAPYSLYLSDYVAPGTERLAVTAFMNDISRPELNVRFRLRIIGQNITIESRPDYIPAPVALHGGIPLRLTSADLAGYFETQHLNFQGITRREYEQRGKLPEGVYQFCFEVLEYNRAVKISNTGCATAWMILNDPPIINIPQQNEKIKPLSPQNVILQWTPRHTGSPNSAFTTEYEIKMVEIWPATRNPNDAILTSPPIFETTTQNTTIIYGPAETPLELGRKYAFRIKAKSVVGVDELDLFKNNGYSEVYSFTYGDACNLPTDIQALNVGSNHFTVQWAGQFNHTAFKVRYREKGSQNWYENQTAINEANINSLKPNTTYEYEVSGTCGFFEGAYSTIASIKTTEAPLLNYSCGLPLEKFSLDPAQLAGSLKVGDVVKTGDFDVQLTKVSGGNGIFSGEGVINMSFLHNARVKAEFSNIAINKDLRMVNGYMNITGAGVDIIPAGGTNFMDKLDQVLDIADSALSFAEEMIPDEIPNPASFVADTLVTIKGEILAVVKNPVTGNVIVTTTTGQTQELPPGTSYAVTDSKGKGYLVDSNGNVGKTTATLAAKTTKRDYNLAVAFNESMQAKYGFDRKPTESQYNPLTGYEQLEGGYRVPWKAVTTNTNDPVIAKLEKTTVDKNKIHFQQNGVDVSTAPFASDNTTTVLVKGNVAGDVEDLIALITPTDTSKNEQILGKLKVITYDGISNNLIIVPVNNVKYPSTDVNLTQLKTQLNKIYAQAAVSWNVSLASKIDVTLPEVFDDGESGLLANYTGDMKTVINAYKSNFTPNTYYLFLVEKPKSKNLYGYMPRSKQAGFIFVDLHNNENELINTISHELGHGAFTLKHTFNDDLPLTQGSTDNLMDYNDRTGTKLFKYQWDKIHNPVTVLNLFEDDDEGASGGTFTDCGETVSHLLWFYPKEYFTDMPTTDDTLLKYISDKKLWKPGYITASLNQIATSLKKDFYMTYNSKSQAYVFDYTRWLSDNKNLTINSTDFRKAKIRFDLINIKYDALLFNNSHASRCNRGGDSDQTNVVSFLKNQITNNLLKPNNLNNKGLFVWNGRESNLPDPTKYYSTSSNKYDFELLQKHLQYVVLSRNENNQLNGSAEGILFLEKRYQDLLFKCGEIMLTVGMDNVEGIKDDATRRTIIETFKSLCKTIYESDLYFKWKALVEEREKKEYEEKLRKLALEELAKKIEDARASAKVDIIIGSIGIGFLVLFPPTTEAGITLFLADIAQGIYSADQVYGGIQTLSAIQENMFDENKEYKLIRGFLVDENGYNGATLIYDLGNITSGFLVGGSDINDVVNIRTTKSIIIMGDQVKRLLKSTDTSVGIYDVGGDAYTFYKK
jgi:TANFOR domain-containing protein